MLQCKDFWKWNKKYKRSSLIFMVQNLLGSQSDFD
jgi:hypothetical protein